MLKYFGAMKVIKRRTKPRVDNMVFHLHYRVTMLLFLLSMSLVCMKEYIGTPIQCLSKTINTKVLNTYCFIMSTFSVPKHFDTLPNEEVPYPGVGPASPDDEIVYHAYYQWVPFVLFLQAMMFYTPHYIWKCVEGGLLEVILGGLNKLTLNQDSRMKKHKVLSKYMIDHLHTHKTWFIRYIVCEALNFVNVIGNIFFTDYFLGGTFLSYGTDVINLPDTDVETRTDPMSRIFPRLTKCTFHKYGHSGTVESHDAMCVLAVNIINEKIYIFIWFWLIILSVITGLWMCYRVAILLFPQFRERLLRTRGRYAGRPNLDIIARKCSVSDWFLVYHLGRNMDPMVYGEFINEFAKDLENSVPTLERKPMLNK